MLDAILSGLNGLAEGARALDVGGAVMIALAGLMLHLAIAKGVEPLLLIPIGFGCLLANLPLSELMHEGGVLKTMYDFGIGNELFPLLIFVGIGSMTDFTPLLANPKLLLFGAAGQLGIFATLLLALALGFPKESAVAVTPGEGFDAPGYFRLSYATSIERLKEGCDRIAAFVQKLESSGKLTAAEIDAMFDDFYHLKHVDAIFERVFGPVPG